MPECDSSPRCSPAIGTGSDEPGVPRAETQPTEEGFLTVQASGDVFFHADCTRGPEQEGTNLLQADVGVNDEITTTTIQASAREKLARVPIGRQQRGTVSTAQSKQFDPGG